MSQQSRIIVFITLVVRELMMVMVIRLVVRVHLMVVIIMVTQRNKMVTEVGFKVF